MRRGWPSNDSGKKFPDWEGYFKTARDRNDVRDESAASRFGGEVRNAPSGNRSDIGEQCPTCRSDRTGCCPCRPLYCFIARHPLSEDGTRWVSGYICNLLEPSRVFELTLHDGYGEVYDRICWRSKQSDIANKPNFRRTVRLSSKNPIRSSCISVLRGNGSRYRSTRHGRSRSIASLAEGWLATTFGPTFISLRAFPDPFA